MNGNQVRSYAKLRRLRPGSIRPDGWLREFAEINADGWLLRYAREKHPEVYGHLWNRVRTVRNHWEGAPDYPAVFADGLIRYAHLLPDSKLAAELSPWLDRALASQDADGYLGCAERPVRYHGFLEPYNQALFLDAFLYQYEATGGAKLLAMCERMTGSAMDAWERLGKGIYPRLFNGHGTAIMRPFARLYGLTGKKRYLAFARKVMARCGMTEAFLRYYRKPGHHPELPVPMPCDALAGIHNVVASEHVSFPALEYEFVGERDLLRASEAGWEMMQEHLAPDGTPHGNEMMNLVGPRANCEHCSAFEWLSTNNALARITGEVRYADAAEQAFFNGYPAAKTPDGMMVAYMHTPNQLVASEWSGPHYDNIDGEESRQYFSTAHLPLCCNSMGPRAIPRYVEAAVLRSDKGLAVLYYGPCIVTAAVGGGTRVTIRQETEYPFEDEVRLSISPDTNAAFPLRLRIPGWCVSAAVEVNGRPWRRPVRPGSFVTLQRTWRPGDRVTLRFVPSIRVRHYGQDLTRERAICIQRGPLLFALPVPEDWQPYDAIQKGPAKRVESFRVLPKRGARWNYALDLDPKDPSRGLKRVVLRVPGGARPWEHPPFGLQVKARRVENWRMEGDREHPMTPGLPFKPMRLSAKAREIVLVPIGFTRLRMTWLPVCPR